MLRRGSGGKDNHYTLAFKVRGTRANPYDYVDMLPRVPASEAINAARLGLQRFEEASEADRIELPGTLTWLVFSPTTRTGDANPVYAQTKSFAQAEINPLTGQPYPYRCWHELAQVLVAGGAKYTPSTSAQLESMFTGLTRQQGASKHHISQIQISYESRGVKNTTLSTLTENVLSSHWVLAKQVPASHPQTSRPPRSQKLFISPPPGCPQRR